MEGLDGPAASRSSAPHQSLKGSSQTHKTRRARLRAARTLVGAQQHGSPDRLTLRPGVDAESQHSMLMVTRSRTAVEQGVIADYSGQLQALSNANEQVAFYHGDVYDIYDREEQHAAPAQHENSPIVPVLGQQILSTLDPFLALPDNITDYQKSRVQIYIKTLATDFFGVSSAPIYSNTAATGIPISIYSKVGVELICVLVDQSLHLLRGGGQCSKELTVQRTRAHDALTQALRSRDQHFQEVVLGMIVAGLVEHQFGTAKSRSLHSTAMEMLLESKGSIKAALAAVPALEPFFICAQFGFGRSIFSTRQKFESARQNWLADTKSILNNARPIHGTHMSAESAEPEHLSQYICLEKRIIEVAVESCSTLLPPTLFAASMQMLLLYDLAWTIQQCGSQFELALSLFKRIEYLNHDSLKGGASGDKSYELRASVIAAIVSRARRDIIAEYYPQRLADYDAAITTLHMNAQRMFHYLDNQGRDLLFLKFYAWLQADKAPAEPLFSAEEASDLKRQVERTYNQMQQQN